VHEPVGEAIAHVLGQLFDLHVARIQHELAGAAVEGEIEDAVAAPILELVEVVAHGRR
jgi:hypothetical protein